MDREQAIGHILANRRHRADEMVTLDQSVAGLRDALAELEVACGELGARGGAETAVPLARITGSTGELLRRIETARNAIGRTAARLHRPYLTIGAVGRSGQGKSRFLQSLTGLTDQEIPAGAGHFMTGVPSMIRHQAGPTTAEVELHDEASFLSEVIRPYFTELGLGAPPLTVDAFGRADLPELPEGADSRHDHAYKHLRSYRDHVGAYRGLLAGPSRIKPIDPAEIREFVAQHDAEDKPLHNFRAVRRVRITAEKHELGNLAVIDLPGLGDTNLHDEMMLRNALDGEVDIILFLRRPDPIRDGVFDFDVDLYEVARSALPELPLDRWSFFVLNRFQGGEFDNTRGIEVFTSELKRSQLRVTDVVVADCTVAAEVSAAFETVAGHAVRTIDELDRVLVERRRQEVAALRAEAALLVADAREVADLAVPTGDEDPRFNQLYARLRPQFRRGVERLVRTLRVRAAEDEPRLAREIATAVTTAEATVAVPGTVQIDTKRDDRGSYGSALSEFADEMRTAVSLHFLELDRVLHEVVADLHEEMAQVLADDGGLGGLGPERGRDFLVLVADRLPRGDSARQLRLAFQFLIDFRLNYRGMVQHRVRRVLEKLMPDEIGLDASNAGQVGYTLTKLRDESLWEIKNVLDGLAREPHEAVFAVAEEFRDRALRAEGVDDEWRNTYKTLRNEVWPDEFAVLAENTALAALWNAAVRRVADAAAEQGTVI